jgi:hypothetical protein
MRPESLWAAADIGSATVNSTTATHFKNVIRSSHVVRLNSRV